MARSGCFCIIKTVWSVFFCLASDWIESGLHVYQVQSTTHNRRKFRQVARETCGESMEPPDDNLIMFGEISELKGKNSSPNHKSSN